MTKKRTTKKGNKVAEEKPPQKKQKTSQVGIDMNHIPQSLLDEGFKEDEKEEVVIPDPFQCPVCRELLIEPEMFTCGHTLCKICTSDQKKMYSG